MYVLLGNPDTIGTNGAISHGADQHGGRIGANSAAVDPSQFGGTTGAGFTAGQAIKERL
jgi:hypothetical protein